MIAQLTNYIENEYTFIDGSGSFLDPDILIIQFIWGSLLFALAFKFGKWTIIKFDLRNRMSLLMFPLAVLLISKSESWIVFQTTNIYRNIAYGGENKGYGFVSWDVPDFVLMILFFLGYILAILKDKRFAS